MATAWKKITDDIDHKVLVTNNFKAHNASGLMSHVWIVDVVTKSKKYDFCGKP